MRTNRFSLSVDGRTVEITTRPSGARRHCVRARAHDGRQCVIGHLHGGGRSWLAEVDGLSQPILGSSEQVVCAALVRIARNGAGGHSALA